jgi:hypothetical protein
MIQAWKTPQIIKGLASSVPIFDRWRMSRAATGGSDSPRYCYSVWLRHLSILYRHGFRVRGAKVGELGPGDSIGVGIAALLSGASSYVGLDIVPFSAKANLQDMFRDLVGMYAAQESIPDQEEFPGIRPTLDSYAFPHHLVGSLASDQLVAAIRLELDKKPNQAKLIHYQVPWNSPTVIECDSLDLIFSQAVLEHVDALEDTYLAMSTWLKTGGYMSHVIDFGAHHLSPFWNGHWAYSDLQWHLVRGRREFLLNREPLSMHIRCAEKAGLEVLQMINSYDDDGLPRQCLASRFQNFYSEDSRTRGTTLILKKCK